MESRCDRNREDGGHRQTNDDREVKYQVETMGKHVIMTGFMGAGKTTVGKALAEKQKVPFLDTDQLIEEKAGMTISRIFETQGEEAFRKMETSVLEDLLKRNDQTVISVGGGLPLRDENRELPAEAGNCGLFAGKTRDGPGTVEG